LNVSKYRNGDVIPQVTNPTEWTNLTTGAWCYHLNNTTNGAIYGKLYNWYAVNDPRGLAPEGYHIPSFEEWIVLEKFLNANSVKMKKTALIQTDVEFVNVEGYYETKWVPCSNCSYWTEKQKANNPCSVCKNFGYVEKKTGKFIPKSKKKIEDKINVGWNGTNESEFSGLPGGYRDDYDYAFEAIGEFCAYWSSTKAFSSYDAWYLSTPHEDSRAILGFAGWDCRTGFYVRCLKD
jgi:hypothetical protein